MRLVILESPYAGDVERNTEYARACLADSLRRGEAPIASHLLYTQPGVLDDDDPGERELGINAGHAWMRVADAVVVYADYGTSQGMAEGIARAQRYLLPVNVRYLGDEVETWMRTQPGQPTYHAYAHHSGDADE